MVRCFSMILLLTLAADASVVATAARDGQVRKPRPVEPVKLIVTVSEENELNLQLHRAILAELNKRKDVVIVSRRGDFEIYLVARQITRGQESLGYAAASLVVDRAAPGPGSPFKLQIYVGPSLEELAGLFTERLEREFISKRR